MTQDADLAPVTSVNSEVEEAAALLEGIPSQPVLLGHMIRIKAIDIISEGRQQMATDACPHRPVSHHQKKHQLSLIASSESRKGSWEARMRDGAGHIRRKGMIE
ncbi:hypothetical protein NP493_139g04005 [Ridgeia piscesae]|uniref:Uncharacterized protein n=1 Tax=Ridgeia piscesae TaxID=27915 RepID=A0AAD9UG90_RIDPI|nr:hypothetical protein NP493_139g04005 [Ridgeia piscesae]